MRLVPCVLIGDHLVAEFGAGPGNVAVGFAAANAHAQDGARGKWLNFQARSHKGHRAQIKGDVEFCIVVRGRVGWFHGGDSRRGTDPVARNLWTATGGRAEAPGEV